MKKYLLTALLLFTMLMTLVACGSEEVSSDTDVNNSATNHTEVDVPDEPEVPVVDDKDSEVDTEEPVEPEEPVVEMVDWETWATQADNDEVCLVVWNETTGTQKILEPVLENGSVYTVEEGDKFAIPKRDNIDYVTVGFDTKLYCGLEEKQYMEVEIPVGKKTQVSIICSDQEYAIGYWFNY